MSSFLSKRFTVQLVVFRIAEGRMFTSCWLWTGRLADKSLWLFREIQVMLLFALGTMHSRPRLACHFAQSCWIFNSCNGPNGLLKFARYRWFDIALHLFEGMKLCSDDFTFQFCSSSLHYNFKKIIYIWPSKVTIQYAPSCTLVINCWVTALDTVHDWWKHNWLWNWLLFAWLLYAQTFYRV